jgi:NAD(P)-dependent dehydrogenase (short-subunit alcohol dehydrogenase family)
MNEQLDVRGMVAVVTGATRGIGRATAEVLGRAGAHVVVVGRSTRAEPNRYMPGTVEDVVESMTAAGMAAHGVAADLYDVDDTQRIVDETLSHFGRCDILVNNAAYTANAPMMDVSIKRWQIGFRLQVIAPHQLCQAFVPAMIERGVGRVVQISSGASQSTTPYLALYGVTKLAMERWNEFLEAELGGRGVSFNTMRIDALVRSEGFELVLERQGEDIATAGQGLSSTMSSETCAEFVHYLATRPASFSGQTVGFEDLRVMQRAESRAAIDD